MIWWLVFEKKPFQFWRKIWIQVVVILLQLYIYACLFAFHIENLARKTLINDISDLMIKVWKLVELKSTEERLVEKKVRKTISLNTFRRLTKKPTKKKGHNTSTAWFDLKFNRKCVMNSEEQSLLLPTLLLKVRSIFHDE